MPHLARLTGLTSLALDTVGVTDAGVRTLMSSRTSKRCDCTA